MIKIQFNKSFKRIKKTADIELFYIFSSFIYTFCIKRIYSYTADMT